MAITPNTTFVSGAVLTAAQQNAFPRGVVALTNSTNVTITSSVLVGLNTTYIFENGRNYKISTANGWSFTGDILLEIQIAGVTVQRYFDSRWAGTRTSFFCNANGFFAGAVAAGSKQVTVVVTTLTGVTINTAVATIPNQLVIEDIGTA